MEFVFLIGSILITILIIYALGRILFTHRGLIRAYKTSEMLVVSHLIIGIFSILIFFMILCAFNNTFWHLPYLTA